MTISQDPSLLQAALHYANQGWPIFPITPYTKIPLLRGSWLEHATTDPTTVGGWWLEEPNANIATVLDKKLVVDIDCHPGKLSGFEWAELVDEIDWSWPHCLTPSGGYHFYFNRPEGSPDRTVSRPGADYLTGAHYVLLPPSRLPAGCYRWGCAPFPPPPFWDVPGSEMLQ